MNAGGRDSGLCDERRDHSLEASHAKLSGFKVGRTANGGARGLSWAALAFPQRTSADITDQYHTEECQMRYIHKRKNQ